MTAPVTRATRQGRRRAGCRRVGPSPPPTGREGHRTGRGTRGGARWVLPRVWHEAAGTAQRDIEAFFQLSESPVHVRILQRLEQVDADRRNP